MKQNRRRGFTMVELMIVMALMAILAIIAVPSFTGTMKKSRDSRRKGDLSQIVKALETYYNDTGTYPSSTGGKINNLAWGSSWTVGSVVYMSKLPKDPYGPSSYWYESPPSVGTVGYILFARIENTDDPDVPHNASTGKAQKYQDYTCGTSKCNYSVLLVPGASPSLTLIDE